MINKLAEDQNWAKATPILGIGSVVLLIAFTHRPNRHFGRL